eukprot:1381477-Pleurochrysis_carterae.AAC.1
MFCIACNAPSPGPFNKPKTCLQQELQLHLNNITFMADIGCHSGIGDCVDKLIGCGNDVVAKTWSWKLPIGFLDGVGLEPYAA